ncbi:hypothetical protein [Aliiroseovarius subalbicans]|uniref:hypothetical protein n=1 Tax=Aliiroseovarius subalbicans TaxID=2925840 RepID=UPI001F59AE05|nr:hypothetical protein [Aliiroseovarius subalbicans]MCI2399286.1 hypothetical protein [Aliiroseovarius subalbicans]
MKLESRLMKLEERRTHLGAEEGDNQAALDWLWNELLRIAARIEHDQPDEDWCRMQSPMTIAAKVLLTKVGGVSTPALKERAKELGGWESPVGDLFKNLEYQNAT